MNADQEQNKAPFSGKHAELTHAVIHVFFQVYNELGAGFLESVYHTALVFALREAGMHVESQVAVPVFFRGHTVGEFRADMVVERTLLLELKAAQAFDRSHESQVLNYLHATPLEVALLLNFGPKAQFKRFVLDNTRKKIRVSPCSSVVLSPGGVAK